jgi:hypothetical protein
MRNVGKQGYTLFSNSKIQTKVTSTETLCGVNYYCSNIEKLYK